MLPVLFAAALSLGQVSQAQSLPIQNGQVALSVGDVKVQVRLPIAISSATKWGPNGFYAEPLDPKDPARKGKLWARVTEISPAPTDSELEAGIAQLKEGKPLDGRLTDIGTFPMFPQYKKGPEKMVASTMRWGMSPSAVVIGPDPGFKHYYIPYGAQPLADGTALQMKASLAVVTQAGGSRRAFLYCLCYTQWLDTLMVTTSDISEGRPPFRTCHVYSQFDLTGEPAAVASRKEP